MRNRLFTLVSCLTMVTCAMAKPIDASKALALAQSFGHKAATSGLMRSMAANDKMNIVYKANKPTGNNAYYYVAEARNGGYVIVSGEDRTQSIIGFVDGERFELNDLPDNMRYWLGEFARQVDFRVTCKSVWIDILNLLSFRSL